MKEKRPSWDEYFLNFAKIAATRSTCFRNHVGAVIVRDKYILSTGYNGAPIYQKNCAEIGHCYRNKFNIKSGTELERCRAVGSHAESNAVALAARNGQPTDGANLYLYGHHTICNQCRAIVANAGIRRVLHFNEETGETKEYIPDRDWTVHPIDEDD